MHRYKDDLNYIKVQLDINRAMVVSGVRKFGFIHPYKMEIYLKTTQQIYFVFHKMSMGKMNGALWEPRKYASEIGLIKI